MEFERLMASLGVSNETMLILYGDKNNWFAAYAYWYLKIYGHEDVRILDGGRQQSLDENRAPRAGSPIGLPASYGGKVGDEPNLSLRRVVVPAPSSDPSH